MRPVNSLTRSLSRLRERVGVRGSRTRRQPRSRAHPLAGEGWGEGTPRRALLRLALIVTLALTLFAPQVGADPSDDYAEMLAQDEDYSAGRQAVDGKDWSEAVRRLTRAAVRHPDNADLHNYLGYAHRHLKQFDKAFEHYKRAIAIEPRHRGAHEYIGEAYLMIGDVASAEQHVAALRSICLLPCEELADLEKAVAQHRRARTDAPAAAAPPR